MVDRKLAFHLREYATRNNDKGLPISDNDAVQYLLQTYKEYQRKPQGQLRKVVSKILKMSMDANESTIQQPTDALAENPISQPGTPSRARAGISGRENNSLDNDIKNDGSEATPASTASKSMGHNLLNQAVCNGYAKIKEIADAAENSLNDDAINATKKAASMRRASKRIRVSSSSQDMMAERPTARYADIGGISGVLKEVRELIEYPLTHPEVYVHLGIEPPRGILLHGPPGCGKTLLANAIAGELGISFLRISAPEIVSGMSGESEQKVRELFATAASSAPCIIFIDEVDAIAPKREASTRGMEKRIVAQILTCMDSLSLENTSGQPVLVIGATNRPNDLDSALRRAGRFDREICLGVPDLEGRQRILEVMCGCMRLSGKFDFAAIARKTPGFVGADLSSLTKEAAVIAINRIFSDMSDIKVSPEKCDNMEVDSIKNEGGDLLSVERKRNKNRIPLTKEELEPLCVTMDDFMEAVKKVQPSAKREGFATVPDVTWSDVGALISVREELSLSLLEPIAHPERFARLGLSLPAGVLLYGPPGCGKTLLAKAIANESGANFISVKGPELLDKYVGESERAVRQVFQRARASSPCIVFFDELDSLCPRRGSGGDGAGGVSERVVNQLLTEMDGLEERRNVFVVAATNRPELIDAAMLRPGRLDKLLFVPLPSAEDRVSILRTLTKSAALASDVDLEKIGKHPMAEGYSGADLSALLREAGVDVLRSLKIRELTEGVEIYDLPDTITISMHNFEAAFSRVVRSVSDKDKERYLRMHVHLRRARSHKEESDE